VTDMETSEALSAQENFNALMTVIDEEGPDMRSRMNLVIHGIEDKIIEDKSSHSSIDSLGS
jgi:hypothetical protein